MPRIARFVVPGHPHHVTQRGNRRLRTFFSDEDSQAYINLMAEWRSTCGFEVWADYLMPNHVHLIAVPGTETGLRSATGEARRRYTRRVNSRGPSARRLRGGRTLTGRTHTRRSPVGPTRLGRAMPRL